MADLLHFYGSPEPGEKLADIHLHTIHSDGWWRPEQLVDAALAAGLSAIAITDHDEIAGAIAAREYARQRNLPLQVLIGQEVSTRVDGHDVHVLGLDLIELITPWQSIQETINDISAQGGFAIMPHPKPEGLGGPTFAQILALDRPVAVEIYNAGVADLRLLATVRGKADANETARDFYLQNRERLTGAVGGTDGHFRTVGRGLTTYRGDLREAIESGTTGVAIRPGREHLMPWDPIGYIRGLRQLDRRRSARFGPRPR